MTETTPSWVTGTGPDADLVVSSRVRLARNIAGQPFPGRSTATGREQVAGLVESAAQESSLLLSATWQRLDSLPRQSRLWLMERQVISRELAGVETPAKVAGGAAALIGDGWAALCNEEDHLRIHAMVPGFAPGQAYSVVERLEEELAGRISFAFHPEFGYLTSCPTNVGTGLRASVLIHLPALVLTREIGKVLHGLAEIGLTHRGLRGEGSEVRGNLFQLSNQITLGKSERELVGHLTRLVETVMGHERRAREVLLRDAPGLVSDRVWRAWGLLRHARLIGYEELVNLLSGVRLGVAMGLLPPLSWQVQNRLLVEAQDAHLARSRETGLDDEALPRYRADLVRRLLDEECGG